MNTEYGPVAQHFVGERLEPAKQHGLLSAPARRWHCQFDQLRCAREILGDQRVADRISGQIIFCVPLARPLV
jgi:hypothetical protein